MTTPLIIEVRRSTDKIPQGQDVCTRMVANLKTTPLDATQQADVMKLFNSIQQVHDNMSVAASQIATLRKTLLPDQFTFIMQHMVCPLIQIKLPAHLCSPTDIKFEKDRLMVEESFEEECSNKVLPQPFHPKLNRVPANMPPTVLQQQSTCYYASASSTQR